MGRKVAVLGTRYPDLDVERAILGPLDVDLHRGDGASTEEIVEVAGDAELILCGSRPVFGASALERLTCDSIVRYGVGVDSIDLEAARERGIAVVRVTDYGTEAVSVHTVALALAAIRRLTEAHRLVHDGEWGFAPLRPLHLPSALTAGVLGFGRIGRRTAALLAGLGFRVRAHDSYVDVRAAGEPGIEAAGDLYDLLETSDLLTLHVPGQPDGQPLLGSGELGLLKHGSILLNTARGNLIDHQALIDGLAAGRPMVAGLDVFPEEPPNNGPLRTVGDRIITTPHMAWHTDESELELRRKAAQSAAQLLRGERPPDVVVPAS